MSGSDPSVGRPSGQAGGSLGGPGGTGGPGGAAGGGGGGAANDPCPGPEFQSAVGSPFPDVVDELEVGEVLDLAAVDADGVRGVVLRTLEGDNVGALTTDILRIRSCMAQNYEYEAEVVQKIGGSVIVTIRPLGT